MSLWTNSNYNHYLKDTIENLNSRKPLCFDSSKPKTVKVEFRKVVYTMPFLFLSGVFTGIAIMMTK